MFGSLAVDILRSMHAARNLVGGYEQFAENDHVVHFAVAHTLVFTLFPDWLKRLTSEFGHIMARNQAVNVPEGVQHLVAGDCDLLIGYHHPQLPIALDPNHFPFLTLGVESIVPVSAAGSDGKPLFELPRQDQQAAGSPARLFIRCIPWQRCRNAVDERDATVLAVPLL